MKKLFTKAIAALACVAMLPFASFSQTKLKEPCATIQVMEDLFKANPQFKAQFELEQKNLQLLIKKRKAQRTISTGPVYTIPVVVHVLHTGQTLGATDPSLSGSTPNPTDAQIQDAVDLATAYYNKRASINAYSGGDSAGIKFCLAKKDPNGVAMPTGAITRHDGSQASTWANATSSYTTAANYVKYGVKRNGNVTGTGVDEADLGNVIKWDPTKYYNVYLITQIDSSYAGAGVKGFAYFPGFPTSDYAVMDPTSFSATNVNVFVHEMGHALNLYHTFRGRNGHERYQGDSCATQEATCDADGDNCCDIPEHTSSFPLFCNTIPSDNTVNTCIQASGSPASPAGTCGEFQHNFMNYGGCPNSFSLDQSTRMRTTLTSDASRINQVSAFNLNACGCTSTTTFVTDLAVTKTVATAPPYTVGEQLDYRLVVTNNGPNNATGVVATDALPNGLSFVSSNTGSGTYNSATGSWTIGNVNVSASVTLVLTAAVTTTGTINNCATVSGNETDNVASNNSSCVAITATTPTAVMPTASFTTSANAACLNSPITFTDASTGGSLSYTWNFGAGANPATSNTVGPHTVTYTTTGDKIIMLSVTNTAGTATYSNTLTVNPVPQKPTITKNSSGVLTSSTATSYQWFVNGTVIPGATGKTYTPTQAGTYTVVVTDANGCTNTSNGFVQVGIAAIHAVEALTVYPNPFNASLTVSFALLNGENLSAALIDYTGKIVAQLVDNKQYGAGNYEIKVNAGQYNLSPGVYLLKLTTSKGSELIKVNFVQ